MKKNFVFLLILSAIVLGSCNAKSAKTAGRIAKKAVDKYQKVNQNEGLRYLRMKKNFQQVENVINEYNVCSSCGGYGVVYHVDDAGYYYTDYEGNPKLYICDDCGGTGRAY